MLGRDHYNVNTMCWEAPNRAALPDEMVDGIHNMLDLLYVLTIMEKKDANLVQDAKVSGNGDGPRSN